MANFLTSVIVAGWVCAIALISVQNARPVTIQFLFLQSVEIPLGLVLASCVALGMVGVAIVLPLWRSPVPSSRYSRDDLDDF
ncbi:LapA family protein [Leptolyngbya sp. FACHB-671]|uniref:lipopolysaccharide assembly protein LapA domain-containing protein n=1 Tax=Leptolyngbya sp. FACHB-671 TaxID=2692812 RepID=UPI00168483AC|nr:LapA family protein [Leptolyngbya sp. FACHB-671]MBD2066664.1 LapA family protein [Leptolyngbya sp. FACHB-671]